MREYGQIQSSFWGDPDIRSLDDVSKLMAAYLLTSPHTNGLGCFRLPLGYLSDDLRKGIETVSKGYAELYQTGFLSRCDETDFILIRNFLKWNPISNPKVAKARVKEFDLIPKKFRYYNDLCDEILKYGSHFDKPFLNHIERVSQTLSKQNPTQPNPNPYPEPLQYQGGEVLSLGNTLSGGGE